MRPLKAWEIVGVLVLVAGAFLFGMYLGNHRAEQNLYLMGMRLGAEATKGNPAAVKACDGLKGMEAQLSVTPTARRLYWVMHMYDQRE